MREIINAYAPWVLSLITIAAMIMTGRRMRAGWGIALAGQALWLTWIVVSGNTRFLPLTLALIPVYGYNFWGPIKVEGWVIMNAAATQYRAWDSCGPKWVHHVDNALCCARRCDAEQLAEGDEDAWRVVRVKVASKGPR